MISGISLFSAGASCPAWLWFMVWRGEMMTRFFVFLLVLLVPAHSMAAAVPAYSPRFGNAMAGVVNQKVAARGFAANDPRFIATETMIGTVLTGAATGLAVSAGLPLWATIAVGAVAAGSVALGVGAVTQWIFNSDGTVTTASTSPSGLVSQGVTTGQLCYSADFGSSPYCGGTLQEAFSMWQVGRGATGWSDVVFTQTGVVQPSGGYVNNVNWKAVVGGVTYTPSSQIYPRSATITCPAGQGQSGTLCVNSQLASWPTSTPAPAQPKTISAAVADVPDSDMVKQASPQLMAQAVNNAWQKAAQQPGYQGVPYTASEPVTPQDVSAWQQANPTVYPTVGDMLSPAVPPGTSVVPQPVAPGTVASPGTATAPAGTPQVNLGTDPVVPLPILETTPTAQMILAPLLGLFPDLKTFAVPSHSSQCPKPSMSLFGRNLMLDGHCTLLETVRPTLYAIMAAVWVMIGFFIILAA